ncbi:MAG: acyltransferase [Butyrivibrio sp.]|nr:acyltransferase [Butyrivibrio sp.]
MSVLKSFYSYDELKKIGLKRYGTNVYISRKASIYSADNIEIGSNVRIDDFCILSGNIIIGDNVHIAAYSALYGGDAGIRVSSFANISSRVCIYAISDDYSGETMTNPTIPNIYKKIQSKPVFVGKHVIIGSGSTVLPGVTLAEGTAIGAMSFCKVSTKSWKIYAGVPAKIIKDRKTDLIDLERKFLNE